MASAFSRDPDVDSAFREAVRGRDMVFLAGSGISWGYPACLPRAIDVLRLSADAALPMAEPALVEEVLETIQPEIFYERLMTLAGNDALKVWEILDCFRGYRTIDGSGLGPTLAHHLIVRLALESDAPILTTNFDCLFEEAAAAQGVTVVSADALRSLSGRGQPGIVVWHIHGRLQDGVTALATTMAKITRPNPKLNETLAALALRRHLAIVGYSGRDLDLFPTLRALDQVKRPFWLDIGFDRPVKTSAQEQTFERAKGIGAFTIGQPLEDALSRAVPALLHEVLKHCPTRSRRPSDSETESIRQRIVTEKGPMLTSSVRLSETVKRLFLGLCLNAVGNHRHSCQVLESVAADLKSLPRTELRARALVAYARALDCVSDYEGAGREADAALRVLDGDSTSVPIPSERIELRVAALHMQAMSIKLQAGSQMAYGDARVDWSPPIASTGSILYRYVRNWYAMWRSLTPAPSSVELDVHGLHAWYWYLDHSIILYAFIEEVTRRTRLLSVAPVRRALSSLLSTLRDNANKVGDSFALANIRKYEYKLAGAAEDYDQAIDIYELITDPINRAVLERDAGLAALRLKDLGEARKRFERALDISKRCGSAATELKALVGLIVCGSPLDRAELERLRGEIGGWGFRRYIDSLMSRAKLGP
jgi:tetratricopeptide (TPR) repeat protein